MIPGSRKPYTKADFQAGLRCEIVGCTHRAHHQWAYPCAVTTLAKKVRKVRWLAVCNRCDLRLNRTFLKVMGIPVHVRRRLVGAYEMIQGDGAFN